VSSTPSSGWAETPGGAHLGKLIADAFARAEQHDAHAADSSSTPPRDVVDQD